MKITAKQTNRKLIIIIIAVSLLIAGAVTFYILSTNGSPFGQNVPQQDSVSHPSSNEINTEPATEEQIDAGLKAKEDSVSDAEDNTTNTDPQLSQANKKVVSVIISSANQKSNGDFDVRTSISVTDSAGTCELTLSKKGANTIIQRVNTQVINNYSVCSGFVVPASDLIAGTWTLQTNYEGAKTKGTASLPVDII